MGLFDGLFGDKLPALDEGSEAARAIAANGQLEAFAKSANDKIEVVPGADALYVFVGKPPKAFGLVWFENGERFDVRSLLDRGELSLEAMPVLTREAGRIYESHAAASRYSHKVGGHRVVVTPSQEMHSELRQAVAAALS